MNDAEANALHRDSIIIDGTCPLLAAHDYVDWYIEGGCTVVTPTVGGYHPTTATFHFVASWLEYIRQRDDLALVSRAEDVVTAKQASKTGVVLHFQGTDPIGSDLNLIGAFKALGVGIMQLCYNTGRWQPPDYPPPPHVYPVGIETPRTLPVLTRGLLERGYSVDDVKRIMGLNLVRLYARVWG